MNHAYLKKTPSLRIRNYEESDWEQLRDFFRDNWRQDHPICDKSLFDWQFGGFGNKDKTARSLVAFCEEQIIGFRGIIPGIYQVPIGRNRMTVIQGGSLAMWMVRKDFRGTGVGLSLQLEAQRMLPVISGAGSNPKTSIPIYLKNGFSVLNAMNRYVVPLDARGYFDLLLKKADVAEIAKWMMNMSKPGSVIEPTEPDIDSLADAWIQTTFPLRVLSLHRSAEFWKWRYLDSAGFRYLFFGNVKEGGSIVARTEKIQSPDSEERNKKQVFRIIEVVPCNTKAWRGEEDVPLTEVLRGALRWAALQGCVAADFFCSNSRFDRLLCAVGFKKDDAEIGEPICSLVSFFQPLRQARQPINSLFRVEISRGRLLPIDFENTYQVKSDNDMDRPNVINS